MTDSGSNIDELLFGYFFPATNEFLKSTERHGATNDFQIFQCVNFFFGKSHRQAANTSNRISKFKKKVRAIVLILLMIFSVAL